MMQLIVGAKGIEDEKEYSFEQNIVKVGRLKENDICLPGANISRLHFTITFESGEYYVTDGSANGTLLNGEIIGKNRRMPLRNGDKLGAGDFLVRFQLKTAEDEFEKTTDYLQAKFAEMMANPKPDYVSPYLLIVNGPTHNTRIELINEMEEILLGRTPDCPVQVPSLTVSKHHARIIRRGPIIEFEDLGSANGSFLNGQPVSGITPLKDRDEVVLGQKGVAEPIKIVLSCPASVLDSVPPQAKAAPAGEAPATIQEMPPTLSEPGKKEPLLVPPTIVEPQAGFAKPAEPPATEPSRDAPPGPPAAPPPPPAGPPADAPAGKAVVPPPAKAHAETAAPLAPPPEIKTGLGLLEWVIIGVVTVAVIAVITVLVIYLS